MSKRSFQRETASAKSTSAPEARRSPGKPLDAAARAFFEPRFGHDFSSVRVHSGPEASQSAREMKARAFSAGDEIVLGDRLPGLSTPQGLGVLAHELAHVVQQRRGGAYDKAGAEQGAEAAVAQLARGGEAAPDLLGGAAPGVYCLGEQDPPPVAISEELRKQMVGLVRPPAAGAFKPVHLSDFDIPALAKIPQPNILPAPTAGPRAQSGDPKSKAPLAPTKNAAGSGPPATVSIPGLSKIFKAAIRLSVPGPDTKLVDGKIPDAFALAWLRNEMTKAQLFGNPAPSVDKGELAKVVYSIVSTHLLKEFVARLTGAFISKDQGGLQFEITVNVPSSGPGATVQAAFSGAGFQALSVPMIGFSYSF